MFVHETIRVMNMCDSRDKVRKEKSENYFTMVNLCCIIECTNHTTMGTIFTLSRRIGGFHY